eukprot:TRINITY_DN29501_c0_g1_i1.p2 TRINITY_DN29501_c0_g1~~TRINITY_DN29501_c0_g1_i1.p2  ORF type:complete len:219 (+),score=28.64 TRINITY_DN29501_c0_g1_i1:471-1127(+)
MRLCRMRELPSPRALLGRVNAEATSALALSRTLTVTRPRAVDVQEVGDWDILHLALVHSAASLRLLARPPAEASVGGAVHQVERTAPDWYGPVPIEKAPGLGTTAYLISRRAMEALVRQDDEGGYTGVPIDDVLTREFAATTFAVYPVPFHRGKAKSLINPAQEGFRAVMYDSRVIRFVEWALVSTGLSSSGLVWVFLAAVTLWTFGVVVPLSSALAQ